MYERFTDRARKVMQLADEEAQRLSHRDITTGDILLGLIREWSGVAAAALEQSGVDRDRLRSEVEQSQRRQETARTRGRRPQSLQAKRAVEAAMEEARELQRSYVGTEHILLGLLRVRDADTARGFFTFDADYERVREAILQVLSQPEYKERNDRFQRELAQRTSQSSMAALLILFLVAAGGLVIMLLSQ